MANMNQQLFISIKSFLILAGKEDDPELLLFDPSIKAVLRSYQETNRFSKNKIAFSAAAGSQFFTPENFVTQSSSKSVLSYFNVHTKEAVFKNGTQEKLDSLCFNQDASVCVAGSLNGNLFFWNSFTGEMFAKLKVSANAVRKVYVDRKDQRLVILTSDSKILVFDFDRLKLLLANRQVEMANFKPVHTLTPHKKGIIDLHFPEGNDSVVFTLSSDNNVKVLDLVSGEQVAEIVLEDAPSCFCTDFLGTAVFVGFVDGKIRKYNYLQNTIDMTIETDGQAKGVVSTGLERQEEKLLLDVRHKNKVTCMVYIPELKEILSSGADDMMFMFTPEGITTYTTGKFKKSYDFLVLVPRPLSFYTSTHFGSTATKLKIHLKPFNKTTTEIAQKDAKPRVFIPRVLHTDDETSLIMAKQIDRVSNSILDTLIDCRRELAAPTINGISSSRTPALKKREIEDLEHENADLKERLNKMVSINNSLLKRVNVHSE